MLAATWSLALAALAAWAVAVDCACPRGFEPLNKTMRRLATRVPMTWDDADKECYEQFGRGFEILGREYQRLTDGERALCQGHAVPLALEKNELKPVLWTAEWGHLNWEEVNSTFLENRLADQAAPGTKYFFGSLNLTTGQWRLVDKDYAFDCAICQRAWIGDFVWLTETPPDRRAPYEYAYTFYLVASGSYSVGVDEAILHVEERFNRTGNPVGTQRNVKVERVPSEPGDGDGTFLRLKSSLRIESDEVIAALNGSYTVQSWRETHRCPAASFQGHSWQNTWVGTADFTTLPDSHVATRRCLWRSQPDGDWDAFWDDDVFLWIDRKKQCQARGVSNLVHRIQTFAERADSGALDLKSFVEITDDVGLLDLSRKEWISPLAHVTHEIVGVLSAQLVATTTSASSACHGKTCAFLTADFQGAEGPDTLLISEEKGAPKVLNSLAYDAANQTTLMSLHLSKALTSAGRVAVHTWIDLDFLQRYIDNSIVVQVVSSTPFDESELERSRPTVIFKVNNTGVDFVDRYCSAESLGESEESNLPCPLVSSEGSVDTYWCNKWVRGHRNFTTGTFIASQINYHKSFDKFTVDQVLLGYTTIHTDKSAIQKVADFTNRFVKAAVKKDSIEFKKPNVDILHPWEEILNGVVLTEERVLTASLDHVKVLVSDLTVSDPVVGFSLDRLAGAGAVQTVTAGSRNVSAESEVDLVLGAGVQKHCQQLAVLAVTDVADFHTNGLLEALIKRKLMVVYLVITSRSATEAVYFDIHIRRDKYVDGVPNVANLGNDNDNFMQVNRNESQSSDGETMPSLQVATWSETARDWLVSSCTNLRSTRASKPVVRCESLTFADKRFRGKYLIFEPVGSA